MIRISTYQTAAAVLAACAIFGATSAGAAVNLLADGDFEGLGTPDGSFKVFNGGQAAGAWTVLGPTRGGSAQLLSTHYTEPNIAFDAESGDASFDLSGPGNVGSAAGIAQTVDTVEGRLYRLSFWVGNADGSRNGNYTLPSTVDLRIARDGARQHFTNAATTPQSTNWMLVQTTFRGTGSPMEIAFLNGTPKQDAETGLDNVSLTVGVPEPATWAMMILGFGLAGAGLRRRQALTVCAA